MSAKWNPEYLFIVYIDLSKNAAISWAFHNGGLVCKVLITLPLVFKAAISVLGEVLRAC